MQNSWLKQNYNNPLFPDIVWNKPEQRSMSGKLLIIGGNQHDINTPSSAYNYALVAGVGECRVIMPDATRKLFGKTPPENIEFVASTPSGSFSRQSYDDILQYYHWADATLFAGGIGRNSETAILLEELSRLKGPQTYTRDSADQFISNPAAIVNRPQTILVATIAQLQAIGRALQLTTAVTFGMSVVTLASHLETLTSEYPACFVVLHQKSIIVAMGEQVSITKLSDIPTTWRLITATYATIWQMQQPANPFKTITTAITQIKY